MESQETQTPGEVLLREIAKACNEEENAKEDKAIKNKKKKRTCQKLGQDKHACCDRKIKEHQDKSPPKGDPPVEGEQGYERPKWDPSTKQFKQPTNTTPIPMNRNQAISDAIATANKAAPGGKASSSAISAQIGAALQGNVFPDAAILGPNGEKTFVDFKFACPESHRSKRKKARKNYRKPKQSKAQERAHNELGRATGGGKSITIQM